MKLIFFLIAFFLVFLRFYFIGPWFEHKAKGDVTITIESGDDYEQIRYGGKITLTGDQKAIQRIAPGGYIKYRHNERMLTVTSNLQGDLAYSVTYNGNQVSSGGKDTILIREAIDEMIAYGFEAQSVMEHIYSTGGDSALLNTAAKIKSPGIINMYMERLIKDDSNGAYTIPIIRGIGAMASDNDKTRFMSKLDNTELENPETAPVFFDVVEHLGSDKDKMEILSRWTGTDTIQENVFIRILDITSHLGSSHDKQRMIYALIAQKYTAEKNWLAIIDIVPQIGSDQDKSNLLIAIAQKMPASDNLISAYKGAAKAIGNDIDYGRAIRALE